jgi:hypothetical protein
MDSVEGVQVAYHMVMFSYLQMTTILELHSLVGASAQSRPLFKTCMQEFHEQAEQLFDLMDSHWRFSPRAFIQDAADKIIRARLFPRIDNVVVERLLLELRNLKNAIRPLHSDTSPDLRSNLADILTAVDEFYATVMRGARLMRTAPAAYTT